RSEFEVDSGEELEPIIPGASAFHRESGDGDEVIDDEKDDKDQRILKKTNKDSVATSVSVLKSISLDE
ncbi:TBC1 domain family member 13-like, partial [Trifolium medium]|nr:TBC1 domain family member 13-like [Trifolium medium]